MGESLIAVAFLLPIGWLSVRADARLRDEARLPMQWWFDGRATWTAPRAAALAFTPALAALVLSVAAAAAILLEPRRGQEGLELPVLAGLGAFFLLFHLLHLRLIDRSLRRR